MTSPSPTDARLLLLSQRLATALAEREWALATAESCTGGLIAKLVTDVPGSSAWFSEGWVTYSNRAKTRRLGVSASLILRNGAVSESVARAMARGALSSSRADLAVAVTGIAGPDGGVPGKPVGTVWIAWAQRRGASVRMYTRHYRFRGDRDSVRRKTAKEALIGLLRLAQ